MHTEYDEPQGEETVNHPTLFVKEHDKMPCVSLRPQEKQ